MNTALYKALTSAGVDGELAIKAAKDMTAEMATRADIAELKSKMMQKNMMQDLVIAMIIQAGVFPLIVGVSAAIVWRIAH